MRQSQKAIKIKTTLETSPKQAPKVSYSGNGITPVKIQRLRPQSAGKVYQSTPQKLSIKSTFKGKK